MNKLFHMVCEGQTDFEIFKKIIEEVGRAQGKRYSGQVLFPPKGKNIGGWSTLRQWCKDRAAELVGNQNRARSAALLLGAKPSAFAAKPKVDKIGAALALKKNQIGTWKSVVVVHIDSDIAEDLIIDADLGHTFTYPLTPNDRLLICEAAIDNWLGGHISKKNASIIYCISSFAIENWVLTLHSCGDIAAAAGISLPNDHDVIHLPDRRLLSLGYKKDSSGKLEKKASIYKEHARKMTNSFATCCARSARLVNFCSDLVAI